MERDGEIGHAPVAAQLALVEDFADQIEVLVFFVAGRRRRGRGRGERIVLWHCHIRGVFVGNWGAVCILWRKLVCLGMLKRMG